jgi:hypothetical protein
MWLATVFYVRYHRKREQRWFRYQTTKRVRRGLLAGVPGPVAAINHHLENHVQGHLAVDWNVLVETVVAKMTKCKVALDAPCSRGAGGSRA